MIRAFRSLSRFCLTTPNTHRPSQFGRVSRKELFLKYRPILNQQVLPNLAKQEAQAYFLERNQIETRIRKVLYDSAHVDLKSFKFSQDLRKDLRLDELQITELITSIEAEFTTVFEDTVFEGVSKISDLVKIIQLDELAF